MLRPNQHNYPAGGNFVVQDLLPLYAPHHGGAVGCATRIRQLLQRVPAGSQ